MKETFETVASSPGLSLFNDCSMNLACEELPSDVLTLGNLSVGSGQEYVLPEGFPDVMLPPIKTSIYSGFLPGTAFFDYDRIVQEMGEIMEVDDCRRGMERFALSPATSGSGDDPPQRQVPWSAEIGKSVIYSCVKVLTGFQARHYSLLLPASFAKRAFPSKLSYVNVYMARGRGVIMRLRWKGRRSNEVFLIRGWKDFTRANNLRHGNVIKFSVLSTDETSMFIRVVSN
ncbi:hypothetical protein PIB30_094060 [Stylosanthes scabra]|uniref:TF-B3 domain-containing protein n=1 Tax=Stylosanthes scabra TaxID=79078 RepID=A0ABU6WTL6_9FABA|nr:hypothetical protein [Stylosanthes scabra]